MFWPLPLRPVPQKASVLDTSIKGSSPVSTKACHAGKLNHREIYREVSPGRRL
jgi:hypothetical protein